MRRIKITGKKVPVRINPLKNLIDLRVVFEDSASIVKIKIDKNNETDLTTAEKKKYSDYLDLIIRKFPDKLLSLTITGMEALIEEVNKNGWSKLPLDVIHLPNIKETKPFGNIIYEKMQYDDIRHLIMPAYIRLMGLKSCCYCNANYTITNKKGTGHYQLDHWKPKSLYSYLCISYFNLQPCCTSCNLHKSNDDTLEFLNLYKDRMGVHWMYSNLNSQWERSLTIFGLMIPL